MQTNRIPAPNRDEVATNDPRSSFRVAVSQARLESRSVGLGMLSERDLESESSNYKPESPAYEVRIEKRTGKRSSDSVRWNNLGLQGCELVSVVGKQSFFRRVVTERNP